MKSPLDYLKSFGLFAAIAAISYGSASETATAMECPRPNSSGQYIFPDGSIGMRTQMNVNPDGSAASYTPGDHGFTYINNGVNLIENGRKVSCSSNGNGRKCRKNWKRAEEMNFGRGSPEFCVFAMVVEKYSADIPTQTCEGTTYRKIVGNGKGKPKLGPAIKAATGGEVLPYLSTTALRHTVSGKTEYIDSSAIPGLVVPQGKSGLLGAISWVKFGANEGFAIVSDTGPAYGEGSIALHELLRRGKIGPLQPVGPIPLAERCSEVELGLKPPFTSRPDYGRRDRCRTGHVPRGATDIRAYSGISGDVVSIIMPSARPEMAGTRVKTELTADGLEIFALEAGYSKQRIAEMAACIKQ